MCLSHHKDDLQNWDEIFSTFSCIAIIIINVINTEIKKFINISVWKLFLNLKSLYKHNN